MHRPLPRAAVAFVMVAVCVVLVGRQTTAQQPNPDDKDKFDRVTCWINEVDRAKSMLKVRLDQGGQETTIGFNDKTKAFFGNQPIKLEDVKGGMRAELLFPVNGPAGGPPAEMRVSWLKQMRTLTAIDTAKNTVSFQIDGDGVPFTVSLDVNKEARIILDGFPAGLADIPLGRKLYLDMSLDKKSVIAVESDSDPADLPALAKSYDATAQTLLVEVDAGFEQSGGRFSRRVTLSLPVTMDTKVRFKGTDVKLTDLKEGMQLRIKLTADRKTVTSVFAAPPLEKPKQ